MFALTRFVRAGLLAATCTVLTIAPAAAQPAKGSPEHIRAVTAKIDGAAIRANAAKGADWPSYGLDYAETRHSKLTHVTTDNVKDLGLVWSYDLESTRGVEATPVVIDGIMYVTASWSIVHAIDVRTGKRLWVYDPKVDTARASAAVATSSTAAWRSGGAWSMWPPTTAG